MSDDQRVPHSPATPAGTGGQADGAEPADAILVGGPHDQAQMHAVDAAVVHLQIEDLTHRYIRTGQHREVGGRSLLVYNYDGEVRTEPTAGS